MSKQELGMQRAFEALGILQQVSWELGIPIVDIVGKLRRRRYVDARRAVTARMRDANFSYPEIGYVLNRDHSSILNYDQFRTFSRPLGCSCILSDKESGPRTIDKPA
jgi:chromosomal replication initiation ATPase DnaA